MKTRNINKTMKTIKNIAGIVAFIAMLALCGSVTKITDFNECVPISVFIIEAIVMIASAGLYVLITLYNDANDID